MNLKKWVIFCFALLCFSLFLSLPSASVDAASPSPSPGPTASPTPTCTSPEELQGSTCVHNHDLHRSLSTSSTYKHFVYSDEHKNLGSDTYHQCPVPGSTNNGSFDVDPSYPSTTTDSSGHHWTQTHHDHGHYATDTTDSNHPGYSVHNDGSSYTVVTDASHDHSDALTCSVSIVSQDTSRDDGETSVVIVYKNALTSDSSSTTVKTYWVTKVDMTIGGSGTGSGPIPPDGAYSYEDESAQTPACTKWYGPSQNMNAIPCTITPFNYSTNSTYATQCYQYDDPYTIAYDKSCTRSYYISKMTIDTGPSKVYTAIPVPYTCYATFYSWTTPKTEYVTSNNKTWFSVKTTGSISSGTNYNFIGQNVTPSDTHNARYYYTDPYGQSYTIGNSYRYFSINSFISSDSADGNYNIYCHYIPKDYGVINFSGTSNSAQSLNLSNQKTYKTVTHYGIKELRLSTSGCFNIGTGNYTCSNSMTGNISGYLLPNLPSRWTAPNDEWTLAGNDIKYPLDFLTGNWYDFKAEIMYTDNSNGSGGGANLWRDITDAPEVQWSYFPNYTTNNTYNTLMPHDGRDHRISGNGKNTVRANFYNNAQTIPSVVRKTTFADDFWAHQVSRIIIRGLNSYPTYPKVGSINDTPPNPPTEINLSKINLNDTVHYTAWVIWSDLGTSPFGRGLQENWTNELIWYGDDMIGKGSYQFVRRGNQDYRTVKVSYSDPDAALYSAISKIGANEWEYAYDKLSVYIEESCTPPYLVVSKCQAPKNNDLTYGYTQGQNNVITSPWYVPGYPTNLPPSLASKYGFTSASDCDIVKTCWIKPNNPYHLTFKFGVTGASNGVAEK